MIPVLGSTPPALDAGHELADLLQERAQRQLFRHEGEGHHLGLQAALDELEAWLNDSRPYEEEHKSSWKSMAADVVAALAARGPSTIQRTPEMGVLIQKLNPPTMGDDPARRADCQQQIGLARAELEHPDTVVAAFDDLLASTVDLTSSLTQQHALLATFVDCLRASGRTVQFILDRAAGALRNNLFSVKVLREQRGDQVVFDMPADIQTDAGLTLADRADLCRDLLTSPEPARHHVVWLCYEDAQVRDHAIGVGPVTFFDGPRLVDAIEQGAELYRRVGYGDGSQHYEIINIPEIPKPDDQQSHKMSIYWPALERWVAARVDLGLVASTDPITSATREAERLVRFTAFQRFGTSWRLMDGYQHVTDDLPGALAPFRSATDRFRFERDETDFALEQLSNHLGAHLPITDPHLQALLDAAVLLDRHYEDLDPASIRDSVSVINQVAGLKPEHWRAHLTNNFALSWARRMIGHTIQDGVNYAARTTTIPDAVCVWKDGERRMLLAPALTATPGLLAVLPVHHRASRVLRELARRTSTAQSLEEWVAELVENYERLSKRLLRCRNSLTHGGPLNDETARTVQDFARDQARRTLDLAFWAVVGGSNSPDAHQKRRQADEQWLAGLSSLSNMAEAFK